MIRSHVLICGGTGCTSSGSLALKAELEKQLAANGLTLTAGSFDVTRPEGGMNHEAT